MTNGKTSWVYRIAVGICVLAFAAFVSFWIATIVGEFERIRVRTDLAKAIDLGQPDRVLSLLDRLDPDGDGTAADYSGESELAGETGMSWLLARWRTSGHTWGTAMLYERRARFEPQFPREELIGHLEWMRLEADRKSYEALFLFALSLSWEGMEDEANRIFHLAESDEQLALFAWEAVESGKLNITLPKTFFDTVLQKTDLSDPEKLDRLLRVMGILEPVETFVVRESNQAEGFNSGISWIERMFAIVANEKSPLGPQARAILDQTDLAKATPETPGLFLLNRLRIDSEPSPVAEFREFSPSEIELALPVFSRLPPEGKSSVARLLDRNIPTYGNHEELRSWVGTHLRPEWEEQRNRLALASPDEIKQNPPSVSMKQWLDAAGKYGFAEETTAIVSRLHQLDIQKRAEANPFSIDSSVGIHPIFYAATNYKRTKTGSGPLPERFSLVLAFGRDPSVPPCERFPLFHSMCLSHSKSAVQNSPWFHLSTEEFHEAVTRLGEPFAADPLRFLIVPFFNQPVQNLSKSLQNPAEIARFQKLAASNNSRGAWLAKDLADLLPRWWCKSKSSHAALLANGGHTYSYDRVNTYLKNTSTPVAARTSYAMGAFDWDVFSKDDNVKIGAPLPYFPDLDTLAVEFANQFRDGRWEIESISAFFWKWFILRWLEEPSVPDSNEQARNRQAARKALRARLDPYVRKTLAAAPSRHNGARRSDLDDFTPFLQSYAALLRIDGDEESLAYLWKEAERTLVDPRKIFPSNTGIGADPAQLVGSAAADMVFRRYREHGWEGVIEYLRGMEGPVAYGALSEATSRLDFKEWVDFCSNALDLRNSPDGPGLEGWNRFCAFPPSSFIEKARSLKGDERIGFLRSAFSGVTIPERHAGFFSLSLPILIGNCVNRWQPVSGYTWPVMASADESVSPAILREFDIACNTAKSVIEKRHLNALSSKDIPVAQRWTCANFFQISIRDRNIYHRRIQDWPDELRNLAEAGIDLLFEASDEDVPMWNTLDRGLGRLDSSFSDLNLVLWDFLSLLVAGDKDSGNRVSSLLEPGRITSLLRDHPRRANLLMVLYELALQTDRRVHAVELFVEAEPGLSFEKKLEWLSRGKFHAPIAHLFSREWHRIVELSLGFSSFAYVENLDAILSALPDDPDLQRLVRATLQHHSMSTTLVNPSSNKVQGNPSMVVDAFLGEEFKNKEMEALCLSRLPVRMEQSPQLARWLEERLRGQEWKTLLSADSTSFRRSWPYWSRWIEALAGSGQFEELGRMLPEPAWFAGRRVAGDFGNLRPEADTVEEIVWMGFARPVAHQLRFGSAERRLDAGAIAARLLASPPSSSRLNEIYLSPEPQLLRPSSFHADAAHDLWLFAIAASLSATLHETDDVAVANCRKFELPSIRSVNHDRMIRGASHQTFFRVLVDFGQSMTEKERTRYFLRGFQTASFARNPILRALPCHFLCRSQLPDEISVEYMVGLARIRSETAADTAFRIADLGLVLHRSGDATEARDHLRRALSMLNPQRPEDLPVIREIQPIFDQLNGEAEKAPLRPSQ